MLLIELNEFNSDLLRSVAHAHRLKHVEEVLNWKHARTWTSDEYETGFLEPWVQWVSVHTGVPSSEHGVKNLGDVPNLAEDQIWERWSRRGLSSIVWGVMNGNRRNAENCRIFIPDPWTFSESAYPAKYQGLIALPRYLAKNYLDFSKLTALRRRFQSFEHASPVDEDFRPHRRPAHLSPRHRPVWTDQCRLHRILRISVRDGIHSSRRAEPAGCCNRFYQYAGTCPASLLENSGRKRVSADRVCRDGHRRNSRKGSVALHEPGRRRQGRGDERAQPELHDRRAP